MDIFEGGPMGNFFEILSAESPALTQNKTAQALNRPIACERTCEARGISEEEPDVSSRKIGPQDGLNDEFCR